jgi:hypothetical protein
MRRHHPSCISFVFLPAVAPPAVLLVAAAAVCLDFADCVWARRSPVALVLLLQQPQLLLPIGEHGHPELFVLLLERLGVPPHHAFPLTGQLSVVVTLDSPAMATCRWASKTSVVVLGLC